MNCFLRSVALLEKKVIMLSFFLILSLAPLSHAALPGTSSIKTTVPQQHQQQLTLTSLTIGTHSLKVHIATDPTSREKGLQHQAALPPNEGMLFVFPTARPVSFWMKDTPLPLSIAYLNASGRILEIHDLKPFNEQSVPSNSSFVFYALEVPRGWFTDHQILPGDFVSNLPSTKSAQ